MGSLTCGMPVLVVESDQALPGSLYKALANLGIEVLGPTDDFVDVFSLARDRRPQLAILDEAMGTKWLLECKVILAAFGVPCLEFPRVECDRVIGAFSLSDPTFSSSSRSGRMRAATHQHGRFACER